MSVRILPGFVQAIVPTPVVFCPAPALVAAVVTGLADAHTVEELIVPDPP